MKAGDIVWVKFPYEGKLADKPHPALVLDVLDDGMVALAYGSSRKVDRSAPRPSEVVVWDYEDLRSCRLWKPTRFDLGIRARLHVRQCAKAGTLPERKYRELYRAAVFCGLIDA